MNGATILQALVGLLQHAEKYIIAVLFQL